MAQEVIDPFYKKRGKADNYALPLFIAVLVWLELLHSLFQCLTGDKLGDVFGLDFDLFAGLRIASLPCLSFVDLKGSKTDERHRILFLQGFGNG